MNSKNGLKPGNKITAAYRNNNHTGRIYTGIVLADNDIKAWIGTMAFNFGVPESQEAVDNHVNRNKELFPNLNDNRVPVEWEFNKVYWENSDSLELVE